MLNQQLYDNLKRKFKNYGDVLVANEGMKNQWHIVYSDGTPRKEILVRGENYRVNCPWCNDTRHRCYVSYEFGVVDYDGQTNLHLINCYNEQCYSFVPERRSLFFYETLFGRPVYKANIQEGKVRKAGEYIKPGTLVPIQQLDTNHPAVVYMLKRNFSIPVLGAAYKIAWCKHSELRYAQSRIIIPITENNRPVGWLARIAEEGEFRNEEGKKIPKYFNMPGLQTQRCLFNFDRAKHFKTIIIVEGAFDAITVGAPAVGLLGKSISQFNLDKLVSWAVRTNATIVIALDPDKNIADRATKHPIEISVTKIKQHHEKVMSLYLPPGTDPASISRQEFKRLLYIAAEKQNVTLDFTQMK